MRTVTVELPVNKAVFVTGNHGGYKEGRCLLCDAHGWLDGFGYPHRAKMVKGAHLQHTAECPLNEVLNTKGGILRKQYTA